LYIWAFWLDEPRDALHAQQPGVLCDLSDRTCERLASAGALQQRGGPCGGYDQVMFPFTMWYSAARCLSVNVSADTAGTAIVGVCCCAYCERPNTQQGEIASCDYQMHMSCCPSSLTQSVSQSVIFYIPRSLKQASACRQASVEVIVTRGVRLLSHCRAKPPRPSARRKRHSCYKPC
jgi:hypothetical protein